MQADEEFRSRLRDDLGSRPEPPVGTLAADALDAGRRLRRRQRTLRGVGGVAAVAAVTVGSVTLSGAFGSDTGSAAGPASGGAKSTPKPFTSSQPVVAPPTKSEATSPGAPATSAPGSDLRIPDSWRVPPAAKVTNPEWVTPRAVVAEAKKVLSSGVATSTYSGDYAYAGGDPREMWAVDGQLVLTTAKGPVAVLLTLHKFEGVPAGAGSCGNLSPCVSKTLSDGSMVRFVGEWGQDKKGAFVEVTRPDGMSVQATTRDTSRTTPDELFALASAPEFGGLKMEKSFVQQAESTIKGDFMNPPSQ